MMLRNTRLEEAICADAILSHSASTGGFAAARSFASGSGSGNIQTDVSTGSGNAYTHISTPLSLGANTQALAGSFTGGIGANVVGIAPSRQAWPLAVGTTAVANLATLAVDLVSGGSSIGLLTNAAIGGGVALANAAMNAVAATSATELFATSASQMNESVRCRYNGVRIGHLDVIPNADASNLLLLSGNSSNAAEAFRPPVLSAYLALLAIHRFVLTEAQFVALARQLEALLGDEDGMYGVLSARSFASFRGLIGFLAALKSSKIIHPSLSISRQGLFIASWSPKKRAKLSLTFDDHEGGSWFAVSLEDAVNEEGYFALGNLRPLSQYATWLGL
jgi:hypothetical protein